MDNKNNIIKKKKGNEVILILLLIIIILSLVCYICYDKGILFSSKEASSTNTTEKVKNNMQNKTEEENITFTDSELEKYVNYISPVSIGPSALIFNTDHISSKNLSAADKIKYIGSHVYNKHTSTSDYQYDIISEKNVKNEVEQIYGLNTYEKTTFNLGCSDYSLNESEGNYYSKTGCGGTTATFVSNLAIDYKATKSKLEITTAYAFFDGMSNKIYKDYNKSIPLDNYNANDTSEIESYLKDYIKNNKEKLSHIVYTFESKDGKNYYFKEFTNNK